MPSYPIRPTFPIDVHSLTGTVKVGRQGTAVTLDVSGDQFVNALPPTSSQFFGALEPAFPGATATVQAAIPSDPTSAVHRAYQLTVFVTPGCALLALVQAMLDLSDAQVTDLLAAATLQPK
ncbi:hypothetical protein GU700_22660 [Methylobacterium sp. NI91]|nr:MULTISPECIES: hypothetical protein [unclassified Methylobacterium]QIJ77124.1 hypothetical protein CLZ_22665 [Methylobacterium sp. CLZ]QIJ82028.1 hypothetical protein GU700_22660 [Methylobacterium sp. NI91]